MPKSSSIGRELPSRVAPEYPKGCGADNRATRYSMEAPGFRHHPLVDSGVESTDCSQVEANHNGAFESPESALMESHKWNRP